MFYRNTVRKGHILNNYYNTCNIIDYNYICIVMSRPHQKLLGEISQKPSINVPLTVAITAEMDNRIRDVVYKTREKKGEMIREALHWYLQWKEAQIREDEKWKIAGVEDAPLPDVQYQLPPIKSAHPDPVKGYIIDSTPVESRADVEGTYRIELLKQAIGKMAEELKVLQGAVDKAALRDVGMIPPSNGVDEDLLG